MLSTHIIVVVQIQDGDAGEGHVFTPVLNQSLSSQWTNVLPEPLTASSGWGRKEEKRLRADPSFSC